MLQFINFLFLTYLVASYLAHESGDSINELSTMHTPSFQIPPPATSFARLSYPAPHVLLVTLSRPRQLNCINGAGGQELHQVWAWMDAEPSLRIGIVTGEGRAFCAGADLKGFLINPSQSGRVQR